MKKLPLPSKSNTNYVYAVDLNKDKTYTETRLLVQSLNDRLLKKGAKYKHIEGREYKSP